VPAVLDDDLEICVGDRKICGHGAGQIEDAVVVCGNLIERFDHDKAMRVLGLDDADQAEQTLALMRRFVTATPVDPVAFQAGTIDAYAAALGLVAVSSELSALEHRAVGELDEKFSDGAWTKASMRPVPSTIPRGRSRQVKVRAGVFTYGGVLQGTRVTASIVKGRLQHVRISDGELNGRTTTLERALGGVSLESVPAVLEGFGEPGRRIVAVLAGADPGRI
jgi:lipoate-protein ligase A